MSATESITTSFGYDAAGNLTRYTDGRRNTTNYTFNSWGLPESVIEPSTLAHPNLPGRTWQAAYDKSGNAVSLTAPGGVRQDRTFNAVDQLLREAGTGAESHTTEKNFTYDLVGRLLTSSAPGGTNTFTYNDRGSLLTTNGPSGTSSFEYDADGNPITRTDASGTSRYGYTSGRLTTLQDGLTDTTQTLGYNNFGVLSTIDYGGGRTRTFTYDNLARPATDTLNAGSTPIAATTYGYDLRDRLTAKTTQGVAGAGANTYGYDFADRLTSWTRDGVTTTYGWDAAGNRHRAGDKTATFDERNRLTSDGTNTYSYTPRGTLAAKTTGSSQETFSFDAFDRLVSQGPARYTYDALDRVVNRNAQQFTYTGATNELASDGTTRFSRGPLDELLALGSGADKRVTVADQHGDIIGGFDPATPMTGLTDSISYDPFGQPTATSGTRRPIGFQGDYTDPDTGHVNMTARWYNPAAGAFTSRDNISLPSYPSGSANRYTYTHGSPLNHTDPTGHRPDWDEPGGRAGSGSDCTAQLAFAPCPKPGGGIGSGIGFGGFTGRGGGAFHGPGHGGRGNTGVGSGRGGRGSGTSKPKPRPDPSIAAREANRQAARNNPLPIPQALLAPTYGNSTSAPVSSAPHLPSRAASDHRDAVDDVNRSYQKLQESLTTPAETLLGKVKDTVAAPSEVTPINLPFKQEPCMAGNCDYLHTGDPNHLSPEEQAANAAAAAQLQESLMPAYPIPIPDEVNQMDPKQRQHWLFQQLQLLQGASGPAADQFYQFKAAYCAEYADPYCGGPTAEAVAEFGMMFFPWTRLLKGIGALVGAVGRGPAIGFAPGLGASALTANRLQHGTRHLTDAGLLPKWGGTTSPKIIRDTLIPILERPAATIDDVLGGTAVKGFVGDVNGQRIVVFVFKEGPYQGQLATSYVPSASQLAKWGL